ncbi:MULTISPECIES: TRAP transporter small permease [Dethiosulfovibrio]|uniref:TRAP transporter small permease n=2 Tax=Dethiosulfovibrio TaxID=47054 RepID=A0ABS9EKM7_9BACT|nr:MULTISPECIES: TRAP transporter small permease [Dethiosulfovibrio]MCF4113829.1 TRAP transporter small permease [Dethiosulfovibrio russensis]MCF4141758.1 TRAP transporter small permease [Dethiosulfovibrio marinus]MCF4143825.1 TRAP transporter small permease [Dethiosulfovibrio acidaminovorans]MEA3284005.1 TRAP transporter small permease [Synergistota bacterium]
MAFVTVLSDRVNRACEVLLFVLMIAMVALTTAQILCRIFGDALIWSEELVRFMLVGASLVGAAVAFYRGSHISITFLTERLPRPLRLFVAVVVQSMAVAFFVIVGWYGGALMETEAFQTTPALGVSMRWIYAMYPLFCVVVILHLVAGFKGLFEGDS